MSEARSTLGLLGRKVGMTRIFTDDGESVPVTVLDVSNNRISQVKTAETDGYSAVQVAYGTRKSSRVAKPQAGRVTTPSPASRRPRCCASSGSTQTRPLK
jgi:large subunit ribosomal protein L3